MIEDEIRTAKMGGAGAAGYRRCRTEGDRKVRFLFWSKSNVNFGGAGRKLWRAGGSLVLNMLDRLLKDL